MKSRETDNPDFRFPKSARLHHRSLVEGLFRYGKSFYEFPYRVTWRLLQPDELEKNFRNNVPDNIGRLQMMVVVPKKKRRRAVDRVLMRRRIRESYRKNRGRLEEEVARKEDVGTLSLAFVYIHDKNIPYRQAEQKMQSALSKLTEKLIKR